MLNTPSNAIGATVPIFGGPLGGGGGGGGGTRDHQGPKIIVGNETNGDTIDVCDYLDAGDGVELAAALTAASAFADGVDLQVRPGLYALTQTLTVPGGCVFRGGGDGTIIQNATDVRTALTFQNFAYGENFSVLCSTPAAGATGVRLVDLEERARLFNVNLRAPALEQAQQLDESLTTMIEARNGNHVVMVRVLVQYSRVASGNAGTISGIRTSEEVSNYLSDCLVIGADIGYDLRGRAEWAACTARGFGYAGARLQPIGSRTACPSLVGGTIDAARDALAVGLLTYGVLLETGVVADGALGARIQGLTVLGNAAGDAGSVGIQLDGDGDGTIVNGCTVIASPNGILGDATQDYANVVGNIVQGATVAYNVLGPNCNTAENITIP